MQCCVVRPPGRLTLAVAPSDTRSLLQNTMRVITQLLLVAALVHSTTSVPIAKVPFNATAVLTSAKSRVCVFDIDGTMLQSGCHSSGPHHTAAACLARGYHVAINTAEGAHTSRALAELRVDQPSAPVLGTLAFCVYRVASRRNSSRASARPPFCPCVAVPFV